MSHEKFIKTFAEDIVMVDLDEITEDTVLDELEDWDSLAIISLNATLDEQFGFTLNEEEIKGITIFKDILDFINKKAKN